VLQWVHYLHLNGRGWQLFALVFPLRVCRVVFVRGVVVAVRVEMWRVEVAEFEGGVDHGLNDEEYELGLLCVGEGYWKEEVFGRPCRG